MDPGASLIGLSFGGGSSAVRQQIIDQLRSPRSATRPAALAEGLGGLSSPYAWDLRSLLQRRGASEAAIGRSLNGNWVAAAVAAGRRPTST